MILSTVAAAALLMSFSLQADFVTVLRDKLRLYYQRHVPVKIHMSFNQPSYAPGDTAYFSLYFFTADGFRPISGRQILNVRLMNGSGIAVRDSRILIVDGAGFNQLPILGSDTAGRYTVVAYSEAMLDAGQSLFFQRPLWVSGTAEQEPAPANTALAFYPEGGHLVAGITNKIVVTGPRAASGHVVSGDGKRVASFLLDDEGLGMFFLAPEANTTYLAAVPLHALEVPIPAAAPDGAGVLATVPDGREPIRVIIQVPAGSNLKADGLTLALTAHAQVYFAARISFRQSDYASLSIPRDNIPEGIARLSLFDGDGSCVSDRLLYIGGSSRAVPVFGLPKRQYSPREEVAVRVHIKRDGTPLPSHFTVTVFHDALPGTRKDAAGNIVSNALLYGDLAGSLNNAAMLGTSSASLDNYLVTRKWERYPWRDVWDEKQPAHGFRKYLHLAGRAFAGGGEPLPDSTKLTFFARKSAMTYETYVDESGSFDFPLLVDFAGEDEIVFHAAKDGRTLDDISIAPEPPAPIVVHSPAVKTKTGNTDAYFTFSRRRKYIDESYSWHLQPQAYSEPRSPNALAGEEVIDADIVVNFDDYLVFPTMSETLREIIPMLQHRKVKNRDVVRLFLDDRKIFAEEEPLFIIDGVVTDNSLYFLNLKPSDVAGVRIIYSLGKLQAFGAIGRNGIVLVETKIPDNAAAVPRSNKTLKVRGLTAPSRADFATPATRDVRVPDLRTNLYWNPSLKTDAHGTATFSFVTSDVTGRYRIRMEGFTADGEPFFAEETFEVSFAPPR